MRAYMSAVSAMLKNWRQSLPVLVLTVVRVYYGYRWMSSGLAKLAWFTDGTRNSVGLIGRMVQNLAGPEVIRFDPLYINKLWGWVADTVFVGAAPALTDALVVIMEIAIGAAMVVGVGVLWAAIAGTFLTLQFFAAGSFISFGYIGTNLIYWQFHRLSGAIGVDGFLRARRGVPITGGSVRTQSIPPMAAGR